MSHGIAGQTARKLITSADIPPSSTATVQPNPEYSYADEFYGRDIETAVHRWLFHTLPRMRLTGLIKQFTGLGVVVYAHDANDHNYPWLSFIYDQNMVIVSDPKLRPEVAIYNLNARQKSQFTLRERLDSQQSVYAMRHRRMPGDFSWAGAVIREGIVVAVSGLTQDEDHMVAEMVAALVLCEMRKAIDEVDTLNGAQPDNAVHLWSGMRTKVGMIGHIEENGLTPTL